MDKVIQKQILRDAGIPVAPLLSFTAREYERAGGAYLSAIERKLGYPCFVKPANTGSSVGIGKAHNRKELRAAVADAAQYDLKIIVEKGIARVREMECSVLGNDEPIASVVGEVISSNEFYDYDAKYIDGKSRSVIPAELPRRAVKNIRTMALAAFRALDCAGMARVDFFVQRNGAKI